MVLMFEWLPLMGFPNEFKFPNIPIAEAYKQCGNSVAVPLIREIAENICCAIDGDA